MIRKKSGLTAAVVGAVALLAGGLTAPAFAGGTDSPPPGECVPQDAWTEEIEHPAEGEEFIEVIDTEAWTETIEHPAVYEDVEHEAVYAVDREYRKQVRGDVWQRDNGKRTWHKTGQKFDWTWWEPASIQWSEQDVEVLQSGPHNGVVKEWTQGNGNKKWRWVSTEYRYVQTGETRQGRMLEEPWTERVLVTEAWTETIEHEATYKTVENPDYVPAWIETIEHPAVECPEPEPTPTPDPEPTPEPDPSPSPEPSPEPTPRDEEPRNPDPDPEPEREREALFEYKTCEGVFERYVIWEYPVDGGERVPVEHGDEKVRELTDEELIEEGCIEMPPPPKDDPEETLAETGSDLLLAALTALGLAGSGAALTVSRRRKETGRR